MAEIITIGKKAVFENVVLHVLPTLVTKQSLELEG